MLHSVPSKISLKDINNIARLEILSQGTLDKSYSIGHLMSIDFTYYILRHLGHRSAYVGLLCFFLSG